MEPLEWIALFGSIAAIITSVVGGLHQNHTNRQLNKENNDLQQQLAGQANQWNIEQWQRENLYNDPQNQLARLAGAGLNPALVYGQGGIMNEAAASPQATMANTRAATVQNPMANLDPLTFANLEKTKAETQAIKDANDRENQKQPLTLEQFKATIQETWHKVDNLVQQLTNMKFDEQLKSMEYLRSSLDYQFQSATFNDAVQSVKTGLDAAKLDVDMKSFDLSRAMQYLSYEVVGWDLSNKRQRALLNIDYQTYRQSEELFESVKRKAYWDSQGSYMDWKLKGKQQGKYNAEIRNIKADAALKELSFWIEARDNPVAFDRLSRQFGFDANSLFNNDVGKFFMEFSDVWNHGINLPIRLGFSK